MNACCVSKNVRILGLVFFMLLFTFKMFCFTNDSLSAITHGLPITKAVLWGHKLHTHTHSYIHYAFHKAFKYLGFDTYWLDNKDDISKIDLSGALFITESQVDQKIPLRDDCFYIIHYFRDFDKYKHLIEIGHCILMLPYRKEFIHDFQTQLDDYVFYNLNKKTLYMPWATDLLPYEIDEIKKELPSIKKEKVARFIGTCWGGGPGGNIGEANRFRKACDESGIPFEVVGGWQCGMNISPEENINLIKKAYLAPAIQGQLQCDIWYIPCRIFKNISCGQLGITNSEAVYKMFNKKVVYNPDPYKLFFDAMKKMGTLDINEIYELMDFVKTKHTYINRIDALLTFLARVNNYTNLGSLE